MPSSDFIIETFGLTKKFGELVAVSNLNLRIKKGEIFGFLGPNGAGKTTTIRMLCGILLPTSGTGIVAGYDIIKEPEKIKTRIGYVSQRFSLYQDLTVYENLLFYTRLYGYSGMEARKRIERMIEIAGLKGREKTLTAHLSGGLKQRLALVSALVHEPEILFLDEPTVGVDPITRKEFWDILRDLTKKGYSLIVTTHLLDEAYKCDTLGFMHRGKLLAFGTPDELTEGGKVTLEDTFVRLVRNG